MPEANNIFQIIIRKDFVMQLNAISLFNDTVYRRTDGTSIDILVR